MKLGAAANPSDDDSAPLCIYSRIEDGAVGAQRIGQNNVGGNFVALGGVENDSGCCAIELGLDNSALNYFR
jgi:hypothetical protein